MEFINVRELRINTGQVWGKLEHEKELVVTSNGKPIALMTQITGNNLEDILAAVRRARGEWAVRKMRRASQEKDLHLLKDNEIEGEIKKARRDLKK